MFEPNAYSKPLADVLSELTTTPRGLTAAEAAETDDESDSE